MAKGILGRKLGMTQIFDENGVLVPVTVVDVADNVVLQQKNVRNRWLRCDTGWFRVKTGKFK